MKNSTNKFALLCILFFLTSATAFSAGERFRSISTGDWNSTSTWEMSTNGGSIWFAATSTPSDTSGPTAVRTPDVVTVTVNVSIDELNINNGGTLSINNGIILTITDGTGTDLTVSSGGTVSGDGTVQTQGADVIVNIDVNAIFSADFTVNSGSATVFDPGSPFTSTIEGEITIDNGATLKGANGGYHIVAKGNVLNNGTIEGGSTTTFNMRGASLVNNGAITIRNLSFDSITVLSGNGTYTSNAIVITSSGNVSLSNDVTFTPLSSFSILAGGVFDPTNIFTFDNGTFVLNNNASILNTGTFKTRDTVTLNIKVNSNFYAPLNISDGLTTLFDPGSPFNAPLYGTLTVDAGATLQGGTGGYTIIAYDNVINEGSIIGTSTTSFSMKGTSLLNNGSITITNLDFDSTTSVSGSGSFSSNSISVNSQGNVSLSNDIPFTPGSGFTVNASGVLNLNGNILTFLTGTFLLQIGGTVDGPGLFRTQDSVTLNIRHNSNFNCRLNINSGETILYNSSSPFTSTLFGTLTVDAGADLVGGTGNYFIIAMDTVTNDGTIKGTGGSSLVMKGPHMINNNIVSIQNMRFDSTTALSGTGTYTSPSLTINPFGNVTLTSDMNFAPAASLVINNGGILNLNSNTLAFASATLLVNNGGTIENSGLLTTDGTVTLDIRVSSNFNVPLEIKSGTTSTYSAASPFTASLNGPVTVDSGATWHGNSGGYTLNVNNDITNNGTISGNITAMKFFGKALINNGIITVNVFNFESGNHTLQGTGSWATLGRFLSGSITTLLSTHQMQNINVNAGGTFDITSQKLLLSAPSNPITQSGTFTTTGSTIEYNGTAAQVVATNNVDYHSLTINNAAGVNLPLAETVPATLTLTIGTFTTGANLTLGNGATIVRQDGTLSAVPTFGANVNVKYIGTNATNSSVEIPATTTVLRNLTIDNTGGVTLTAATTVNDTIFLTSGVFTPAGNLTMADPITINRATGTFNTAQTFPANVNVVYSGATAINTDVELPATATELQNLTVNNPGGVTLFTSITVNDLMSIVKGHLDLNGNIITLGSTASMTETDSNTVNGSAGYIVAFRDLNAPSSENVAGMGAIITTADNMGPTEIRRGHTIQTEDTTQSIARYYDILPTYNTNLNATLVFIYDPTELNGSNEENLVLFRSTNGGTNWIDMGGISNPPLNQVTLNFVDAFSRWTAGDSVTSLPVELASFTSSIDQRDVKLNWTTAQEINNSGFEIERSEVKGQTSNEWSKIGFVEGNGTVSLAKDYSFTDQGLNSGKYNYRLKQIDYNGNYEYFNLNNEVVISLPEEFRLSQNYPNPFNPTTKINYELPLNGNVNITLFDMTGREVSVLVNESQQQAGFYTIQFNASNLSSGTYFYKIVVNGDSKQFLQTKKMTIIK
ncbi:MAG TPA: T9SS type A sorting domain-containing protein [Ignavibacteria bacterium]|nr:T9SS type A sorting domain-containing protein [Ignavibacteria bacterium]